MERGRFAILLSAIVVLVGSLVFLKWVLVGHNLERGMLDEKELRVLSYSTFVSSSGPAPELIGEFEKRCRCKVKVINAGDAGLLLERLKMTQEKAAFDLVIGFDQFWASKAKESFSWLSPELTDEERGRFVEVVSSKDLLEFAPFDYAPMTLIYRKDKISTPPKTLKDLLEPKFRSSLSLQDPRSSSPGLQFLSWIERTQSEPKVYLKNLTPSIHSVSPSWALSYGLFKKGQSQFVFSYVTSLAYHLAIENSSDYEAVSLEDGHPIQVEYIGIPQGGKHVDLARDFVRFVLESKSQELISQKNFMLPVVKDANLPQAYHFLPQLKTLPLSLEMPSFETWDQVFQ